MKANLTLLTCFLSLMAFSNAAAQVVAGFTPSSTSGCSPLTVKFINSSTGPGTLTYEWDLGNTNLSNKTEPEASYSTPGVYTVKLTVHSGSLSNSIEHTITVFKNPVANFTSSTPKSCVPINISFNDASVKGDANIIKWNWDFRNGTIKNEQSPSINYTSPGTYDVFLEVMDANNCTSSIDKKDYIDVIDKPVVGFQSNPPSSCSIPSTVQFTNNSSGGGNLTYAWDFTGGVTSTAKNPTHTYTAFGTYDVKLVVTSDYGCSSTLTKQSVVGEVKAVGTIKRGSTTIANGTVCAGKLDFLSSSAGNPNCLWDFGDGSYSYLASDVHTYSTPGTFKIRLIAAPGEDCADTIKWNIVVEKPIADFILSLEKSCTASTLVTFTNKSSANSVSYVWTFPDGSTSTTKDIFKTFTVPPDLDEYEIHQEQLFSTSLKVTTANGCSDEKENIFFAQLPTALFSPSVARGCAPLKVTFKNKTLLTDLINSYEWDFGEGSPQNTTDLSIDHVYNTPGTYKVKLTAKTKGNCIDESPEITINVGSKVTPDFTVNNPTICSTGLIDLTNLTVGSASKWNYTINGNNVTSCSNIANPSVNMKTEPGLLSIKLEVNDNGCFSETTKANVLTNTGPSGKFDAIMNCSSPRSVTFKAQAQNHTSFKWDFGDGQINTTDLNSTHVYAAEKNYTVKFITINALCTDTFIRVVKVRDHQPSFTYKTEACADESVYFESKLSHKLSESCSEKYLWNFNDLGPQVRTRKDGINHSFKDGGIYDVKLLAFYDDGCADSITQQIHIFKPDAKFDVDKSQGCAPLLVTFTDKSTPDVHSINSWNWNFGDGNISSYAVKKNTLTNSFTYEGEYPTVLIVQDVFGCSAKFEMKIGTASPKATFNAITSPNICAGNEVEFVLDYPNPDNVVWNFGNGNTVNTTVGYSKFLFPNTGSYDVSATVYKFGCSDYSIRNDYVQVQKADASFSASDTTYNCYPRMITFTHLAGDKDVQNGKWFYGHNDNTSSEYTTSSSYNYPEPGSYLAHLIVETTNGCTDDKSLEIKITGPVGQFVITPKNVCKGDEVVFTLKDTLNIFSYQWDLGDGNFSKVDPAKHKYATVGDKTCRLVLYSDDGKCKAPVIQQTIHVYNVIAEINVADTAVCEGTEINFNNSSKGANSFTWNLGDGTILSSETVKHTLNVGTYKVSLAVSSVEGCKDTTVKYMVINPMPKLSVSKDTIICLGGTALLTANSNAPIVWTPVDDLSSPGIPNPIATPKQSIYYKVYATDILSKCQQRDSIYIDVQQVPEIQLVIDADSIIAGRELQLTANTEENAIYEWSPADYLSCSDCFNPISTTRATTNYLLKVTDKNHCFTVEKPFTITVEKSQKDFDVPSAFIPGGDGTNSVFKVRGFNVKQLLEFKIYNRWGNVIFSSTDLSKGWDGTYQGKMQPLDTYVYTIKIETFEGKIESKTGTILLMR